MWLLKNSEKAQDFIDLAIIEITTEVKEILSKNSMSLPKKIV